MDLVWISVYVRVYNSSKKKWNHASTDQSTGSQKRKQEKGKRIKAPRNRQSASLKRATQKPDQQETPLCDRRAHRVNMT